MHRSVKFTVQTTKSVCSMYSFNDQFLKLDLVESISATRKVISNIHNNQRITIFRQVYSLNSGCARKVSTSVSPSVND